MKTCFAILLACISTIAYGQSDKPPVMSTQVKHATYQRHTVTATVALGFFDYYREYYKVPTGFVKGNTSGFAPVYLKLEYGLRNDISLAATMSYDAFNYNYRQKYIGNNGLFTRYRTNNTRIFSGGLTAFYHLGKFISVKHLDPFVGLGISLNNIRYGAYPQGDSTLTKFDHTVTPYLKAGARYYISNAYSLYADIGYDQQSIFSVGASCRFLKKKK